MKEGAVSALPSKGPSGRLRPHQTFTGVHPRQRAPLVGGTHHEKDCSPYMPVPPWLTSPRADLSQRGDWW